MHEIFVNKCVSQSFEWFLVSSVRTPCIYKWKFKPLKILAFKGSGRNNELRSKTNGLKDSKNSIRLEESEEAKSKSLKAHNVPFSYASRENESLAISLAYITHKTNFLIKLPHNTIFILALHHYILGLNSLSSSTIMLL